MTRTPDQMPGWWRAAAAVRHDHAIELERALGESTEASLTSHRLAAEYERRAQECEGGGP